MGDICFRPVLTNTPAPGAHRLSDWPLWFSHAVALRRDADAEWVPASDIPADLLENICRPRAPIAGLDLDRPRLMGVLNVTPDSFSDGGQFASYQEAVARGQMMVARGADILDVGGESTRPGADLVADTEELNRIHPVISDLAGVLPDTPISVDTRKASVAEAALVAGAALFNDVSALSYDSESLGLVARAQPYVCLMHASGDPKTMQDNPDYDDVVLDVYDYLKARVDACLEAGLPKDRIVVDPGIGFGKTITHNFKLIQNIAVFHTLGCPILLGVSRKRFIGTVTGVDDASKRGPGSVAVALHAIGQGVQIIRAHDIEQHAQAMKMCWATLGGGE